MPVIRKHNDHRFQLKLPQYGRLPRIKYVQVMTQSHCSCDCLFPLSGDTEVITPDGNRPIGELVGSCKLLAPAFTTGYGGSGIWYDATVRSYGVRPVLTVTMKRGAQVKEVRATSEHRWVVKAARRDAGRMKHRHFIPTKALNPGDMIPSCYMASIRVSRHPVEPSPFAIAQGFTFGDGQRSECGRRNTPASVHFYSDKDEALKPYFSACELRNNTINGKPTPTATNLPRFWKGLPPLDESRSFLLGWLAGYFAADGHVSREGQVNLYSANKSNLEFVQTLCCRLGIRTLPVRTKVRVGFGVERPIHSISFDSFDVPGAFWILNHHRERIENKERRGRKGNARGPWKIMGVHDRGETEEVFCATVPGVECFALSDNVLTGNCPWSESEHVKRPGKMRDETWNLILDNLAQFGDSINEGKVCPYLMNEPLLDKTIFAKIDDIYRLFPNTCVEVSTNGAALTEKNIDQLLERFAGKRHEIWVSHHGIDHDTFTKIMAQDYDRATSNLLRLVNVADGRFNIKIRGAGESRDGKHVYFTRDQYLAYMNSLLTGLNRTNVSIDAFRFHDRAGTLHRSDRGANELKSGFRRKIDPAHPFHCWRLDEWLHFKWDGSLVLCCMDYHSEVKLPNIHEMSLLEYFHSREYYELIEKVSGRKACDPNFICARCESVGG